MATGELKVFMEIWSERPHKCFITGDRITNPSPPVFAHVLGKGGYPKYRLEKFNIVLMLPDIHRLQHAEEKQSLSRCTLSSKNSLTFKMNSDPNTIENT